MSSVKCERSSVHLDTVLSELGAFGRYQLMAFCLLAVPYLMEAMYSTHFVFTAAEVDYRCKIDECDSSLNSSFYQEWIPHSAPANRSGRCYRHPASEHTASQHTASQHTASQHTACGVDHFDNSTLLSCHEWVYRDKDTFVAEFELACSDWKRTLVGTMRNVGALVALMFAGQLSDRLGRKMLIYVAGTLCGLLDLAKTFSTGYIMYMILDFLESLFCAGLYNISFVYSIEFVSKDNRILFTSCLGVVYSIGGALYTVLAWQVPYWRLHLRLIYAPTILICSYAFFLDESVRWLLSKGKKDDAIEIIKKIAKLNRINIKKETLANLEYEDANKSDTQTSPFRQTIKSKVMLSRFGICCFWWVTSAFIYYGLTIGSVSLGGDKYWNFALSYLVDVPSTLLCAFILDFFGRRRCLLVSFTSSGLVCAALVFLPPSIQWLKTLFFLLGKFSIGFTFCVVYVYTSELFPTYTRNSMQATCSCVGRIGSILAPQLPLLSAISPSAPPMLYAGCSLAAAALTLLTPDTRRAPLPDNVHQAERIHAQHSLTPSAAPAAPANTHNIT